MDSYDILGVRINHLTIDEAVKRIVDLARVNNGGYAAIANVSSIVEANYNHRFRNALNQADLIAADGMPLVWGMKFLGARTPSRVCGPAITPLLCEAAAKLNIPVGFYGSTEEVLELLVDKLKKNLTGLMVAYSYSPPFRQLYDDEEEQVQKAINASGAKILFVGLGCPKQEIWMAAHKKSIKAVMVGVGAAFDFISGSKKRAPLWMQKAGLEWLYRLMHEPRRLWRRYLFGNAVFVYLVCKAFMRSLVQPFIKR